MENQIVLKQSPIIAHKLQEAGKQVQKRIDELELDKQICTEENVKSMKKLKAELNGEFKAFEEQRGNIKKAVNSPYDEFEAIYKAEITERYKLAETTLKNSIDSVEFKIKKDKENNVKEYFDELCLAEKIDFLKWEQLGIEINLSTTEKKYKEQVYDFIVKVNDDLSLIKTTDYEAEILIEYKATLNASKSITTVKERKEKEAAGKARIKAELIQNRKNYLSKLGLNYVEITNQYEFNDNIFVSLSDITDLSKEDFTSKYAEIEAKIKDLKSKEIKSDSEVSENTKKTVSAPISAPVVETIAEEIKTASFEVKAPLNKLRLLGEWMKQNGIEYKNI